MRKICSYCRKELWQEPSQDLDQVSHGMCVECYLHFKQQWKGLSLGQYLDQFDFPVVIVDDDVRLVAANQVMADLLNMNGRDVFGLLGGEVMECVYARLPEGCGRTMHCSTCTFRNSVKHTISTKEPLEDVPASIDADDDTVHFKISTRIIDDGEGTEAVHVTLKDVFKGKADRG